MTDQLNYFNVALIGNNYYARQGIALMLQEIAPTIRIKVSVSDHRLLDLALKKEEKLNILFFSGSDSPRFDSIQYIKELKNSYPDLIICIYAMQTNSLSWVRGGVDSYISLQAPIYHWHTSLLKMLDPYYLPKKRPVELMLTATEWKVLKELKNGVDIRYIAEREKLSYRRVSAVKSSAIRKLGLRNKTDLLVFLTS